MRPALAALGLVAVLVASVPAAAAPPAEIDVLEGYLAEHDRTPGLAHCARHDGYVMAPMVPARPSPAGGTNSILEAHKAWHIEHGGRPGHRPSPDAEDRYGDHFVYWHRDFVAAYDAWRAENGYGPVAAWDPATPIPEEFAYDFPGRGCVPGRRDPEVALPTWTTVEGGSERDPIFGHTRLCDFEDMNAFGKALGSAYHETVHARMRGDMAIGQGPRDPAFWAYHRFIDDVTRRWESSCGTAAATVPSAEVAGAPVPGPGLLPLGVAAGVALHVAGRIRASRKA